MEEGKILVITTVMQEKSKKSKKTKINIVLKVLSA